MRICTVPRTKRIFYLLLCDTELPRDQSRDNIVVKSHTRAKRSYGKANVDIKDSVLKINVQIETQFLSLILIYKYFFRNSIPRREAPLK